ncbi:hypothetical protein DMH15_26250 [Streptomyces sp. WAC 06725]|uniref:hypothetical protein n=1 Tax=Streptomyces sp. WAC 06725 TaxID=2203209 RepID=UPI000F74794A|nr:hypothetical protein [Streptomyces sp. WAC 06725]RSO30026.1 hypothetical protein DMH15_26250 [Streptomyces sp. WAC 06725]
MIVLLAALAEVIALDIGASAGGAVGHGLTGAVIGVAAMQVPLALALSLADEEFAVVAVFPLLFGSTIAGLRVGEVTRPLYGWLVFANALIVSGATVTTARKMLLLSARSWSRHRSRKRRRNPAPSPPAPKPLAADSAGRLPPTATYRPPPTAPPRPPRTNAEAHRAIGSTYCESCGHLGYDVENYAIAASPSWYRGRSPACGHEKEFSSTM